MRLILIPLLLSACSLMGPPDLSKSSKLAKKLIADCSECFHFPNKDHSLGYYESQKGSDKAIIMIHGSPGDWGGYSMHITDKRVEQYKRISVDRPGYKSSKKLKYQASLDDQARYIKEVIDSSINHNQIYLVAHSYGVPVALQVALNYPEKIKGLVLVAGSVDPDLEKTKWFQTPAIYPPISWIVPNSLNVCNREILALKPELLKQKARLSQIEIPVTVIQGAKDVLVPKENADYLEHYLTNAQKKILILPGKNHFILWSEKDLIIDELVKIMND